MNPLCSLDCRFLTLKLCCVEVRREVHREMHPLLLEVPVIFLSNIVFLFLELDIILNK